MISYGIVILPLIRDIRDSHLEVSQPWYDDEVVYGGGGEVNIKSQLKYLISSKPTHR